MRFPEHVTICEVGHRDWLQNEAVNVPTADKVWLIEALLDAGIRRVEATSFVSPKWIPNLADAGEVMAGVRRQRGVTYAALLPNLKGLERAFAAKVDEAVIFLSASESHSRKNINKGIAEALVAMGVDEVGISDTTGMANPRQVYALVSDVAERVPVEKLSLHFHDTRGAGLANILAGLQAGVTIFDGSVGGLGGCPYAKGATGNVATEDLVHMLREMGIETGVDLPKLITCARLAQDLVGRPLESHVAKAGPVNHAGGQTTCG